MTWALLEKEEQHWFPTSSCWAAVEKRAECACLADPPMGQIGEENEEVAQALRRFGSRRDFCAWRRHWAVSPDYSGRASPRHRHPHAVVEVWVGTAHAGESGC